MRPVAFPEANTRFGPPTDLVDSQCMTIPAHVSKVAGGSVDGAVQVIVAWKPTTIELADLVAGKPIFMSCLGGLPPHFLTTDFETAKHPA